MLESFVAFVLPSVVGFLAGVLIDRGVISKRD